jgi:hypothetical protein
MAMKALMKRINRNQAWGWPLEISLGVFAVLACPLAVRAEDRAQAPVASAEPTLEDLGAELMNDSEPDAPKPPNASPPSSRLIGNRLRSVEADSALRSELVEGEDLGAGEGNLPPNWLQSVEARMRAAHSLLVANDASGLASSTQQQAIDEIDAMIAKLQKQCEQCGGQCKKPSTASSKPSKPGDKTGAKPGEAGAAATAKTAASQRAAIGNLVKDLWGQLPQRQREELLQPLSEEFLPEYAADIEEYFRALAETPENVSLGPPEESSTPSAGPQP